MNRSLRTLSATVLLAMCFGGCAALDEMGMRNPPVTYYTPTPRAVAPRRSTEPPAAVGEDGTEYTHPIYSVPVKPAAPDTPPPPPSNSRSPFDRKSSSDPLPPAAEELPPLTGPQSTTAQPSREKRKRAARVRSATFQTPL